MEEDNGLILDPIIKLHNNTYIVKTQAGDVLVNCPPETLKFLLAHDLEVPKIILLPPDVDIGQQLGSSGFVHHGINYASIEFLLYANYFFNGGNRTHVVTTSANQSERIKQILQETIIGPSEPSSYFPYPWVERECEALSIHPPLDRTIQLDDLVHISSIEIDGGNLGDEVFISLNEDNFNFIQNGEVIASISCKIDEPPMPLLLAPLLPVQRQEITLQFIGGSDGFDTDGITTCFLAYFGTSGQNSTTLFDAAAYMRVRLGNLGISTSQITEVVISHLHEDHIAGLPELLLLSERRVSLLTSDIIYRSLLRVLSAMFAAPEEDVAALFDYYPLNPGQSRIINGKKFEAIYAIHSIPTLAVRVNGLCYSGDMRYDEDWFIQLEEMGILSSMRRKELIHFADGARILVHDAGGGSVHTTVTPKILNSLRTKSNHIILTHTQKDKHQLPTFDQDGRTNIEFAKNGHVTAIGSAIEQTDYGEKLETISACPLFSRLTITERASLVEKVTYVMWEAGQTILQEGEPSNSGAYIVHKGLVELRLKGKRVQVIGRGACIGERGAITGKTRAISVISHVPSTLLHLKQELFKTVAKKLGLNLAFVRAEWLWKHPIFGHLPWATLLDLALDFHPLYLPTGKPLFEYGEPGHECYLLVSGSIMMIDKHLNPIGTFTKTGEFFGGRSALFGFSRNASACAASESEVWALPAPALQRLHMVYPNLLFHLRTVELKRQGHFPLISVLKD